MGSPKNNSIFKSLVDGEAHLNWESEIKTIFIIFLQLSYSKQASSDALWKPAIGTSLLKNLKLFLWIHRIDLEMILEMGMVHLLPISCQFLTL